MIIEIFNKDWSIDDVRSNPNKLFIFGDNNARIGKGGQAIIRDLQNTAGIRTKKGPSNKPAAFLSDNELDINCKNIREDIIEIKNKYLIGGYTSIVLSSGGYGTGLAQLERLAPKTFHFLNTLLEFNFYFDNRTGQTRRVVPSHGEISGAKYISIDGKDFQSSVLSPINNSYFRSNLLSKGLLTNKQLIISGEKMAFTYPNYHNIGEIVILVCDDEYLISRITDSYEMGLVNGEKWSNLEGYDISFFNSLSINNKLYQNTIEFIGVLKSDGMIEFNDELFNSNKNWSILGEKVQPKIYGEKIFSVKLDKKMMRVKKLLEVDLVVNDIEPTDTKNTYQVLSNGIYYLVQYKDYLIFDTIKIILSSDTRII